MSEPVSIRKLADVTPKTLVKTTSSTAKGLFVLLAVAGIGWAIYRQYIRPLPTQTQAITIERGATAIIQQKQETKKRLFIFIEPFVEQRQHSSMQTGIRAGVRVEW